MRHEIDLPFPPTVNGLFAQSRVWSAKKGRLVTRRHRSKRYDAWRKEALVYIIQARMKRFADAAVDVRIVLTPPDDRRRDADNLIKPIADALVEAGIIGDDSYVERWDVRWDRTRLHSGAHVTIAPTGELPPYQSDKREPLKREDRQALRQLIAEGGYRQLTVHQAIPLRFQSLIDKGYAEILPGIFDGEAPQGFKVVS